MKRIIDGLTYDTQTAAEVWGTQHPDSFAWFSLHQTRHGAFFTVTVGHDGGDALFKPLTDADAQGLLEERANHLVEQYFGPMPEYGAAEKRLTLRMPAKLARRVEKTAEAWKVPVNVYIMRTLEKALAQGT
jgi:predicted DNA binding CopG/RHH family protein